MLHVIIQQSRPVPASVPTIDDPEDAEPTESSVVRAVAASDEAASCQQLIELRYPAKNWNQWQCDFGTPFKE